MTSPAARAWQQAPPIGESHPGGRGRRGVHPVTIVLGTLVLALAAHRVFVREGPAAALVFLTIGAGLAALVSVRWPGILLRVAHGAQVLVTTVLFAVLGLFAVVLPWLVGALGTPRFPRPGGSTQWSHLGTRLGRPAQPWLSSPRPWEPSARARWQPRLAVLAVLALAAVTWTRLDGSDRPVRRAFNLTQPRGVTPERSDTPAAFADATWYPRYQRELDYGTTRLRAVQLVDGVGLPEFRSRYVNVENGFRRSWSPPACQCRRVRVWMYGASTTFGLGQRDDHTIASELARAAWHDGIAVDVVNKGVPGEQHWQEANRLRWDLTRDLAPDLVVFYDGASEVVAASWINQHGLRDLPEPVEPLTEEFLASPAIEELVNTARTGGRAQPPLPDGAWVAEPDDLATRSPDAVGRLAASRYRRALTMSADLTTIHGLDTHWFWQPTRVSRTGIDGEPTTEFDRASRQTVRAAVARLPEEVVDLTGALDSSEEPIFSDDVHHNELGARLVARAMYRSLRADLERASTTAEGS